MFDVVGAVERFFEQVSVGSIEVYNEFSLQHELGIFLRASTSPQTYKIQFERPVGFFGFNREGFVKNEIDLSIFTPNKTEKVAVEVKFPRNGQYPEQMFKFCQDLAFLEQLVAAGFDTGFFVVVADDPLFYSGREQLGIYAYFRGSAPIQGLISKPTGKRDERVQIYGLYHVKWRDARSLRYALVKVVGTRSAGKGGSDPAPYRER